MDKRFIVPDFHHKISKFEKHGLTLFYIHSKQETGMTALRVSLPLGGAYDAKFNCPGISHFYEHMLFEGTADYACMELRKKIAMIGASMCACTATDELQVDLDCLSSCVDEGIVLLEELILHSSFSPEAVDKEREIILNEYTFYHADLTYHALRAFRNWLMDGHSYCSDELGTPESLKQITADKLREVQAYLHTHVQNFKFLVQSVLPAEYFLDNLHAAGFTGTGSFQDEFKHVRPLRRTMQDTSIKLEQLNGSGNTIVLAAVKTGLVYKTLKERVLSRLYRKCMLAGSNSKLFLRLREQLKLCYVITGGFCCYGEQQVLSVELHTNAKDKIELIKHEIIQTLAAAETIAEQDLEEAKIDLLTTAFQEAAAMHASLDHMTLVCSTLEQSSFSLEDELKLAMDVSLSDLKAFAKTLPVEKLAFFTEQGEDEENSN